jgi:hypothetical protein
VLSVCLHKCIVYHVDVAEKDAHNEIVLAEQALVPTLDKAKEPLPEGDKKVHIIGMRAHAETHHHSHPEGTCNEPIHDQILEPVGHSHKIGASTNEVLEHVRHVVVAQVSLAWLSLSYTYSVVS